MNVKFKYVSIYLNIMLIHFSTNSGYVLSNTDKVPSEVARIKRQAGYVYDKPTVSFELPTATSIATTQAPTVDRTQMQMYDAYPAPAFGNAVNVGQQSIGSSADSTAAVSSGANGYNDGVQNTQNIDSRTTVRETQNTANAGYQSTAVSGAQAAVDSVSGYGDGRPTDVSNYGSTSAPRYLPPQSSPENNGVTIISKPQMGVTITKPSDSYIPPTVQDSSPLNEQTVITQFAANVSSPPVNLNTGYLLPSTQPVPKVSIQPGPAQPVPSVPTQQYLPPIESSGGQKKIEGSVAAPASTYLPPVF